MKSKWERVGSRINAAKRWLAKAEEEFSKERPVRGELNLMLAEAELKRLKESEPSRGRTWLRHSATLGVMVVVCAFSGAWLLTPRAANAPARTVAPSGEVAQPKASLVKTAVAPPNAKAAAPLVQVAASHPAVPLGTADSREQDKMVTKERPAAGVGISDAEMRQLVRKAGQTLRGQ